MKVIKIDTYINELVSVVIPTYNRKDIIERAVNSVLNQTYKNIEIIIVDDNSNDGTEDLVSKVYSKLKNIKYIRHETNRGGNAARNTGLKYSSGKYIAFLDSDDEWFPEKLEKQLLLMHEKKADLVYTDYILFNEKTKEEHVFNNSSKKYNFIDLLGSNFIGTTSTILTTKKVLNAVNGFDEDLPSCQDWDLYIRIGNKFNICGVKLPLVKYYYHDSSITGNIDKVINGHKKVMEKIENIINSDTNLKVHRKKILAQNYERIGHCYMKFRQFSSGRKYFKKSLSSYPLNSKVMIHLITSYLGKNFLILKRYK
ncbi:glycosyltransferase family 2 protein [Clostridium pasteurianum]|uniref:Glycosyl transferase n=1 Tax=Clostridium pasteurianum BC1 TaxID=86416 RepID=R4JZY3_CLOPA|nr:glycosyltransferase family 2 protein [Clostridium pasteurianum]AGK95883.1 glycosyl transferase [Clostridium pasteurianum BC1]